MGGLVGFTEASKIEINSSYAAGTAEIPDGMTSPDTALCASGLFNSSRNATDIDITVKNSYAAVRYGENLIKDAAKANGMEVNGAYSGAGTGGSVFYVKQSGVSYNADSGEEMNTSELAGKIGGTEFTAAEGWFVPDGGSKVNPMGLTYPYNTLDTDLADPYPYPMLQKKLTDDDGNLIVDIVDEHGNPIAVGPGVTFPMEHYGDWVEDNVAAMPIYWESYWDNDADADNGEYGFYGPDGEINSLKAEKPGTEDAIVKADGIAVFVPLGMDAHQISGFVFRQMRQGQIQNFIHLGVGFPYGQTAHGVAVQIQFADSFGVLNPDICKSGALIDAEQHLMGVDGILPPI